MNFQPAIFPEEFLFEAVNRTLHDITCIDKPFGGKVFVFGGGFRQTNQDLDPQETIKQKKFAKFLLDIVNGNYSIVPDTEDSINLPLDLMMTEEAILMPKNIDVEKISELVLDRLPGDLTIYPSADSVDLSEESNMFQPQVYLFT
ncbi:hypothetical protein C1646_763377 [Rhizophagus diaphanus]|nr:hypothetical protein C1646_763377 [Rhizophagus diaphanus] [Rhizophagus sp. MUCL 43196]